MLFLDRSAKDLHSVIIERPLETVWETNECPRDKEISVYTPKLLYTYSNRKIYDIGENTTGIPVIKTQNGVMGKILLKISEELKNCDLDDEYMHEQFFNIICDGCERLVSPIFTWLGGRYLSIKGDCELIEFKRIHSDVKIDSTFYMRTVGWISCMHICKHCVKKCFIYPVQYRLI